MIDRRAELKTQVGSYSRFSGVLETEGDLPPTDPNGPSSTTAKRSWAAKQKTRGRREDEQHVKDDPVAPV